MERILKSFFNLVMPSSMMHLWNTGENHFLKWWWSLCSDISTLCLFEWEVWEWDLWQEEQRNECWNFQWSKVSRFFSLRVSLQRKNVKRSSKRQSRWIIGTTRNCGKTWRCQGLWWMVYSKEEEIDSLVHSKVGDILRKQRSIIVNLEENPALVRIMVIQFWGTHLVESMINIDHGHTHNRVLTMIIISMIMRVVRLNFGKDHIR